MRLTARREKDSDLIITEPEAWAGRAVEQREYSDLMKAGRAVNDKHGIENSSCYSEISKFLLHCTTHRFERLKEWDIEQMLTDLQPVLEEFRKRFAPIQVRAIRSLPGDRAHTTATFRTIPPADSNEY